MEALMPTYVVLYTFTEKGLTRVRETIERADEVRAQQEELGFKIHGMYWTLGHYDLVVVIESPNEEAMMAGLLNIVEAGNVSSQTLRAFSQEEMKRVLSSPNIGASRGATHRVSRSHNG
jgi:uncharacterized protein with GYD domain